VRWMKLTAVPLAPGLEEGLVALDARRMVDLRASPTARDKQKQPVQCRRKSHSAIRRQRVWPRVWEKPRTRPAGDAARHPPPIADDEVAPVEADEADDLLLVLLPFGGLGRRGDQRRARAFLLLRRPPPPLGPDRRGRLLPRRRVRWRHPHDRAQELRIVHPRRLRRLRWGRRESELGRPVGLRWGELLGPGGAGVHGSGPGGLGLAAPRRSAWSASPSSRRS
jgi:hypothetical protein